jgi:hypothetical protein
MQVEIYVGTYEACTRLEMLNWKIKNAIYGKITNSLNIHYLLYSSLIYTLCLFSVDEIIFSYL